MKRNEAVMTYGHGTLINLRSESWAIGGSSGGQTRKALGYRDTTCDATTLLSLWRELPLQDVVLPPFARLCDGAR